MRSTWEPRWNLIVVRTVFFPASKWKNRTFLLSHNAGWGVLLSHEDESFIWSMSDRPLGYFCGIKREQLSSRRTIADHLEVGGPRALSLIGVPAENVPGLSEWPRTLTNEQMESFGVAEFSIKWTETVFFTKKNIYKKSHVTWEERPVSQLLWTTTVKLWYLSIESLFH